ncbi:MAG: helix-turn-helix domain-containing protein [Clostridia bacterium]|nr:helix-turn-helix domain-containing protein [Clostridia bacterium]
MEIKETVNILANFSKNLKDFMFDGKLTPKLLASEIKVDRSVIYKYLRKEILPTVPNLISITNYFECSADYILGLSSVNSKIINKNPVKLSERLKEILHKREMSRYKLLNELRGKNIKIARQSIDDWYNDKRYPSIDNLIMLAETFDCTVDYLLGREN